MDVSSGSSRASGCRRRSSFGNMVYLAGQVASDTVGTGVTLQTQQILAEIDRLLAAAGSDKERILSATVYLADIATFRGDERRLGCLGVAGEPPGPRHRRGQARRARSTSSRSWSWPRGAGDAARRRRSLLAAVRSGRRSWLGSLRPSRSRRSRRRRRGAGRQHLQLVGLHRPEGARRLHPRDRDQGRLRHLRQQRDPGDQAAGRPVRLRHRRAVRALPAAADPGRRLPAPRQVQAEEPRQSLAGDVEPARRLRSRQRLRRRLHVGHHRASATTSPPCASAWAPARR